MVERASTTTTRSIGDLLAQLAVVERRERDAILRQASELSSEARRALRHAADEVSRWQGEPIRFVEALLRMYRDLGGTKGALPESIAALCYEHFELAADGGHDLDSPNETAERGTELRRLWRRWKVMRDGAQPPAEWDAAEFDEFRERVERLVRLTNRDQSVERYIDLRRLGRGGMGEVREVIDPTLDRRVARKAVRRRLGGVSRLPVARLLEEAKIMAELRHPGIVPVHELGVDRDGQVYFTMPFLGEETLRDRIAEYHGEKVEVQARGQLWSLLRDVLRVCEAMAHAHELRIIHRDLKPDNIMVGEHGQTYVMDWGVARRLDDVDRKSREVNGSPATSGSGSTSRLTREGDVLGTPDYMSPEQKRGEEVGVQTDVYSIGAILWHIIHGWTPKQDDEPSAKDRSQPAIPLTRVTPLYWRDLGAVCDKAVAKDRDDRYTTVAKLRDDIHRIIEGDAPSVRCRWWHRLEKWVRRHPVRASLRAASLAVLLCLGVAVMEIRASRDTMELVEVSRELIRLKKEQTPQFGGSVEDHQEWVDTAQRLSDRRSEFEERRRAVADNRTAAGWLGRFGLEDQTEQLATLDAILDSLKELQVGDDPSFSLHVAKGRWELAKFLHQPMDEADRNAWKEVIQDCAADRARYRGIEIPIHPMLRPLGEDPRSGLHEFWMPISGTRPERVDGWLEITEESALVFVLIPPEGSYLGAQSTDRSAQGYDPYARANELPVDGYVTTTGTEMFYLSKYEMNQAQWRRLFGCNKSAYRDRRSGANDLHPVEWLSYREAQRFLSFYGLDLPTEARWEKVIRAGGFHSVDVDDDALWNANLADAAAVAAGMFSEIEIRHSFDDRFAIHAAIGSFPPNDWGIHDLVGNVSEWTHPVEAMPNSLNKGEGVAKGGSYLTTRIAARPSARRMLQVSYHGPDVGVRPVIQLHPPLSWPGRK